MSAAMLALAGLATLAVLPVAAVVAMCLTRSRLRTGARLAVPAIVFAPSLTILIGGARHFENAKTESFSHDMLLLLAY